jgi:hypothetical protein
MKYVKLSGLLAVLALCVMAFASSASALSLSPAGATATLEPEGSTTLKINSNWSVTCTQPTHATGTIPASGTTVTATTRPGWDNCTATLSGVNLGAAPITTQGTWSITATSTTTANINVPNHGFTVHAPGCLITVNASTVTGTWTNGTTATGSTSSTLGMNNAGHLNYTTTPIGGGVCPSGTATLTGAYRVTNTTSGATQPIEVNP